ncbi:hypothetical protein RCIX2410 [Methanocella arvoryzae MRE50]|uniref:Uncharacterized protein n=1 Tax=Methanocella arvoryzae (strain DSM 22066 / NBRC 105507 / MRE50) TaxID=351160 RepID=Q0W294_METAR|nr:hypothetical protein RCIX2410 [Methanocella arvoryzae MRE50]
MVSHGVVNVSVKNILILLCILGMIPILGFNFFVLIATGNYPQFVLMLMPICFVLSLLAGKYAKQYQRPLAVLSLTLGILLGASVILVTENLYLKGIMLLLTIAWSFIVLIGAYNVFIKKQPLERSENG